MGHWLQHPPWIQRVHCVSPFSFYFLFFFFFSFVVIYCKVTVFQNSLAIKSLSVSSPASQRELCMSLAQAVSSAPRSLVRSERLDSQNSSILLFRHLSMGVQALRGAPNLLEHLTLPLVGLLQLQPHVAAHKGLGRRGCKRRAP